MSCGEPCDNCAARAEHHLCETCCHAEPDALSRENDELRAEVRDLRARLKAVKAARNYDRRRMTQTVFDRAVSFALDLKNKSWRRKP